MRHSRWAIGLCVTLVAAAVNVGVTDIKAAATVPGPIVSVTATAGDRSAVISWSAPASDGGSPITAYQVTLQPGGATCSTTVGVDLNPLTCTVFGLTNGTQYSVGAVAKNAVGSGVSPNQSLSVPVSVPFTDTGIDVTLGQPLTIDVSGIAYYGPVPLYPTGPAGNGIQAIAGFSVPGIASFSVVGRIGAAGVPFYVGTSYTGSATSSGRLFLGFNDSFFGDNSGSFAASLNLATPVTVTPAAIPDAVPNVVAVAGNTSAALSWIAPNSNGSPITGYTVTSSPAGAVCTVVDVTATCSGLTNGTSYVFSVVAQNGVGGSVPGFSNRITAGVVPGPVSGVAVVPGDRSAIVSWKAPASSGTPSLTGYQVSLQPGGATCSTTVGVDADPLTCTVRGLSNGVQYLVDVAAVSAVGQGPSLRYGFAMSVPTTAPFTDTGVDVTQGQDLTIDATGLAYFGSLASTDPNGTPVGLAPWGWGCSYWTTWLVPSLPCLSLIGRIGPSGTPFFVGTHLVVAAPSAGRLYLGFNDLVDGYANNSGGYSATITTVGAATVTPVSSPDPVTGVVAVATDGSATLSWSAPNSNGSPITGYTVTSSPVGAVCSVVDVTATCSGLTNGTAYSFSVVATNALGDSTAGVSNAVTPMSVPTAVTNVVATAGNGSAAITWSPPSSDGGSPITGYTVTLQPGGSTCSTTVGVDSNPLTCEIHGLTNGASYEVAVVALNSIGAGYLPTQSLSIPATTPFTDTGIDVTLGQSVAIDVTGRAVLGWPGYFSYPDGSNNKPGAAGCIGGVDYAGPGLPCFSAIGRIGLSGAPFYVGSHYSATASSAGRLYLGYNDALWGFYDNSGAFSAVIRTGGTTTVTPNDGLPLQISLSPTSIAARDYSSVTLNWSPPSAWGNAITGHKVRVSSDNGLSWVEATTGSALGSYRIAGLPMAAARLVEVAAIDANGQGPWSEPLLVTTKGGNQKRVLVQTADGKPVSGGAITWWSASAHSSVTYGLTAGGAIDFPLAPAGAVTVTLTNGVMPDGSLVSGTWNATLGFSSDVLRVPAIATSTHRIHVTIPGGLPVGNASVSVSGLTSSSTVDGFVFRSPAGGLAGTTDAAGQFIAYGYASGPVTATVVYDDGVITQTPAPFDASAADSYLELEFTPFVQATVASSTSNAGNAVSVVLTATTPAPLQMGLRAHAASAGRAGVLVTLIPPAGAATNVGTCHATLSGVTNAAGKVTLRVCASKSGAYRVKSAGAVPVGAFTLFVKGKASLPPRSLSARSTTVGLASGPYGTATVSWAAPSFAGGAAITKYTVTLSRVGAATITKTVVIGPGVKLSVAVAGLTHAKTYTVKVTATSIYGTSDAAVTKVAVA